MFMLNPIKLDLQTSCADATKLSSLLDFKTEMYYNLSTRIYDREASALVD